MRNLKKLLSLVLALALVLSVGFSAFAATIEEYQDADKAKETLGEYGDKLEGVYADAVQLMIDLSVLKGNKNTDGSVTLDLGDYLTRGQFMVMLYKATKGGAAIENNEPSYLNMATARFSDVGKGHWAYGYVNWAGTNSISAGYPDGRFGVNDPITLEQALLLCMKAIGLKTQSEPGFEGTDIQILTLASQLGMLGDLYAQGDKNEINRATACLLFDYMIFNEQIKYSVITGERYRTGDIGVVGSWGTSNNPSWTLAEKVFHLVTGNFTIISDGTWFSLPSITDVVDGSKSLEGKAWIQRLVYEDNGYTIARDSNGKAIYETYRLSKEDTQALGITLEDVGRTVNITFKSPAYPLTQDVSKVYNNYSKLLYVDEMEKLDDIKGVSGSWGNRVRQDMQAKLNVSFGDISNFETYFINYDNNHARALNTIGSLETWRVSYGAAFTYAANGQTVNWSDMASYAAAITASGLSPLDNDVKKTKFAIWLANQKAAATDPYPSLSNINCKTTSIDYNANNLGHADIRVVYSGSTIKYVFINDYGYNQFDKVSDGKLKLKNTGNSVGHDASTGKIKDFGTTEEWAENDYLVICSIAASDRFIIKHVTEKVTDVVTKVTGDQTKLTIGGTEYQATAMAKKFNRINFASGSSYVNFDLADVGKTLTAVIYGGRIIDITTPDQAPDNYCVVMASQVYPTNLHINGGTTYEVQVILQDGTIETYPLGTITAADATTGTKVGAGTQPTLLGHIGRGTAQVGASTTYDIAFKGSTAPFTATNGDSINDHMFAYSFNDGKINLKEIASTKAATTQTGNRGFVTTRFYNNTAYTNDFGALTNKLITSKTVTFIKTGSGSNIKYMAYEGQYVPAFNATAAASATEGLFYNGGTNYAPVAGGAYTLAGFINTAGGNYVTDQGWCVALQIFDREYRNGIVVDSVLALTEDGIKTLYSTGWNFLFQGNIAAGDRFTYSGTADAVSGVARSNTHAELSSIDVANNVYFAPAGLANSFTSNAKFYLANASDKTSSGPWTATEAKNNINLSDTKKWYIVATKWDATGLITEAVIVRSNNTITALGLTKLLTLSSGQGMIQVSINGSGAFVANDSVKGNIDIIAPNGDKLNAYAATVSADGKSVKLYVNGANITGGIYTVTAKPAAFTTQAADVSVGIFANAAQADMNISFNMSAGQDIITLDLASNSEFNASIANNSTYITNFLTNIPGAAISTIARPNTQQVVITLDKVAQEGATVSFTLKAAAILKNGQAAFTNAYEPSIVVTDIKLTGSSSSASNVTPVAITSPGATFANNDGQFVLTLTGGSFIGATGDAITGITVANGTTDVPVLSAILQGNGTVIVTLTSNVSGTPSLTATVPTTAYGQTSKTAATTVAISGNAATQRDVALAAALTASGGENTITLNNINSTSATLFANTSITAADFEVKVNGTEKTVTVVSKANNSVVLSLGYALTASDSVTVTSKRSAFTIGGAVATSVAGALSTVQQDITVTATCNIAGTTKITLEIDSSITETFKTSQTGNVVLKINGSIYASATAAGSGTPDSKMVITVTLPSGFTAGDIITIEIAGAAFTNGTENVTAADIQVSFGN